MSTGLKEYREVAGFEVFDRAEARQVLDGRVGMRVRVESGWLLLSRLALSALAEGAPSVRRREAGVLLAYHSGRRVAAVVAAPSSCPPEKRQELLAWDDTSSRRPRASVPDRRPRASVPALCADWPAAVDARDFVALHGLDIMKPPGGCVAEMEQGMLVWRPTGFPVSREVER